MNASRTPVHRCSPGLWAAAAAIVALASSGAFAADPIPRERGDEAPIVAPPLPPPTLGRTVIADVPSLVLAVRVGQRQLRDFDAEEADVIAQINRSPSTWQTYLLYTSEDLPDRMFFPGFTFVLDRKEKRPRTPMPPEVSPSSAAPQN